MQQARQRGSTEKVRGMFKLKKYGHWYFLALLALTAGSIWSAVFWVEARNGRVLISFLDVGQGDAIFIEAPNGNQILIDGGPDSTILARLGEVMPFWDRSIDLLILTHPHADHLDGFLEVLKRYKVGIVLESGVNHSIPEYREWHDVIGGKNIPLTIAKRGQIIRMGNGAVLDILAPMAPFAGASPKNIHDSSVVSLFSFASTSALFMADAEASLEKTLLLDRGFSPVDILKVGHHGSKTSTSEELLARARPRFAVISVGRKNRYGHPYQMVLDRLKRFGVKIYRTDLDGSVTFASDGKSFIRQ